jgi:N-acetylmuramoyl-L-alanine amidase
MRTLVLGDRGKEVSDIQRRLHALGYELGGEGLDGFLGPKTQHAVLTFQTQRGLLADGVIGPNTWRELVEAGYSLGDRLLYLRAPHYRGDDVLELQVGLNLLGFNAGPERGIFDEAVDAAVKEFQHNSGIPPDGIVGDSTLTMLRAVKKAEQGGMSRKIPERDGGYVEARGLAGQIVVVDPGHGGRESGLTWPEGLAEKDYALTVALRLAELLKLEGCHTFLTRSADVTTDLYARCELAATVAASYFISIHAAGHDDECDALCYYYGRNHYYSEHGQRLAAHIQARLGQIGISGRSLPRNFAVLREPQGISVVVAPLCVTAKGTEEQAGRATHPDEVAAAIVGGLADYLARVEIEAEPAVAGGPEAT